MTDETPLTELAQRQREQVAFLAFNLEVLIKKFERETQLMVADVSLDRHESRLGGQTPGLRSVMLTVELPRFYVRTSHD